MSVPQKRRKIMGGQWSNHDDDYYSEDGSSSDEEEEVNDTTQENVPYVDKYCQPFDEFADNICLDSATDTVDAAPPPATMTITLTLDQVMLIENQLALYEKVSLVYLLYDDPNTALEQLTKLVNGGTEKLVYNWAIHENLLSQKWQEKLVEALCIIQNYQILRTLGFSKEDLVVRFLPHHYFTFLYVNKIRKALLFMCEDFGHSNVENFLSLACSDFQKKGLTFKVCNAQFLELYLLYWEVIGYIKQDNLVNLCTILKQMDQLDLCDKFKQLVPVVPQTEQKIQKSVKTKTVDAGTSVKPKNLFDRLLDPSSSLQEFSSLESHISADNATYVSSENKYDIHPNNPGLCLIINQENFYREIDPSLKDLLPPSGIKLESRTGTKQDKERLENTFKQFGFKTKTADNLIHSDILKKIGEVMEGITDECSFFVCIMSHGDEGVIYGVNSCQVTVKSIKHLMCNRNVSRLTGKPKVLILQSCQGTRCQKISSPEEDSDNETDSPTSAVPEVVPRCADLFTFWATVPGFGAIRNKKTGSWFIQALCEKMKVLGNKIHFEDICTHVIMEVSNKKWRQSNGEVAMVPQKETTLRKLFYLPPIKM